MPRRPSGRRRRLAQASVGLFGLGGLFAGMVGTGGPAAAEGNCENLTEFTAVAAATGSQVVASAPGVTLVSQVDGGMPTAQAMIDSIQGSKGFAGAPYSAAVADNAGAGGAATGRVGQPDLADPNKVPVFVLSAHPTQPKASKPLPAGSLESESNADASSSKANVGGPTTPAGSSGSSALTAKTTCADDTTIESVANSVVTGIDVAGVLKISEVRSYAKAVVSPSGEPTLEGTVEIKGASVGGQAVAITDKGVVLAGAPRVLPNDPITPALEAAGISIRYIAAVSNNEAGQVLAPALEISVARAIPGVGSGPIGLTMTFGRALARASLEPGDGALAGDLGTDDFSSFDDGSTFADTVSADAGPFPDTGTDSVATAKPSSRGGGGASLPTARIADWSIAPGYSAMGVGALLLLVAWVGLEKIAVRFRWR